MYRKLCDIRYKISVMLMTTERQLDQKIKVSRFKNSYNKKKIIIKNMLIGIEYSSMCQNSLWGGLSPLPTHTDRNVMVN